MDALTNTTIERKYVYTRKTCIYAHVYKSGVIRAYARDKLEKKNYILYFCIKTRKRNTQKRKNAKTRKNAFCVFPR